MVCGSEEIKRTIEDYLQIEVLSLTIHDPIVKILIFIIVISALVAGRRDDGRWPLYSARG